ncbi:hypothetical protein [Photobacterium phosphoreum]|uniref:hypothetical protein n=1 Tax=Photobacterium phosphoreum TaxID=659 RepID=UPI000D16940F|nr:hypothetical protein [Photobacterium phosphoreum]PTB31420.1 hypothetical protein DAT36_16800 [Photobacterium phosphoreum]
MVIRKIFKSGIVEYLNIPDDYISDFESLNIEYHDNDGSSGDMIYNHYFEVPHDTNEEFLEAMGWSKGQLINDIPVHVFEDDCHE